jgi:hypothetical protein
VFTQLFQRSIAAIAVAGCLIIQSSAAVADNSVLNFLYPQLTNAMRAHDVVFARVLEEIDVTNSSPTSNIGKGLLKDSLFELSLATASHYHSSGGHLAMLGPYRVFESRATPSLISTIRKQHDAQNPELTLRDLSSLTPRAVATLERGRAFVEEVIAIHVDDGFTDKKAAVNEAIKVYLSDDETSVSPRPKSEDLLSEHEHAYAYSAGFPQFSGLNWASQWLKLATLEIIITSPDRESEARDLENALRLYEDKTTRLHGSLVSLPSDIPAIPSIAPNFYTVHPEASSIIDNLEALKVVIADILSHPDEFDRQAAMDKMVASYTDKNSDIVKPIDYMLFVLRGGIYNAGGPARGGMEQPDRNYSREVQENPHVSKYPMAK